MGFPLIRTSPSVILLLRGTHTQRAVCMPRRCWSTTAKEEKVPARKSDSRRLPGYEKTYHEYLHVVQPHIYRNHQATSPSTDPRRRRFDMSSDSSTTAHVYGPGHKFGPDPDHPRYPEKINFSQNQLPLNSDWIGKNMKTGSIYQTHELGDESKYESTVKKRTVDVFEAMGTDPIKMYKNVALLSQFVSETGMIQGRKSTNLSVENQKKLSKVIKRARAMGLLPYTSRLSSQSQLLPIEFFRCR